MAWGFRNCALKSDVLRMLIRAGFSEYQVVRQHYLEIGAIIVRDLCSGVSVVGTSLEWLEPWARTSMPVWLD